MAYNIMWQNGFLILTCPRSIQVFFERYGSKEPDYVWFLRHITVFFLQSKTEKLRKNGENGEEFQILLHFYATIFGEIEKLRANGE